VILRLDCPACKRDSYGAAVNDFSHVLTAELSSAENMALKKGMEFV